jgi:hypothetical protein
MPKPFSRADVIQLVENVNRLDLGKLFAKRAKEGFRGFVRDLRNIEHRSVDFKDFQDSKDGKGTGWAILKGLVIVYPGANEEEFMKFFELEENMGQYTFFEHRSARDTGRLPSGKERRNRDISPPDLPYGVPGFTETFKILGHWGKNPAMDIAFLLENDDGSLSLQHIVREMDRLRAFVGGMVEDGETVKNTCYIEALQELYSKSLFTPGSQTELLGQQNSARAQLMVNAVNKGTGIHGCVHLQKFALNAPGGHYEKIKAILESDATLRTHLRNLKAYLEGLVDEARPGYKRVDLEHFFCLFKGYFYAELCPKEWGLFKEFLDSNMVKMEEIVNCADSRNTSAAYMVTTPHYLIISAKELKAQEKSWGLQALGGDDAASVLKTRIEDLFDNAGMFSAHCGILLQMLVHKETSTPGYLEHPARQEQLAAIETHLQSRASAARGFFVASPAAGQVPGAPAPAVVLQSVVDPTGKVVAAHLAAPATEGERLQLQQAVAAANPGEDSSEMAAIESLTDAEEYLWRKLGHLRYARICAEMENQKLSSSFRIVLANLHKHQEIVLAIDDSGSTGNEMVVTNTDGTQIRMTRWQSEEQRVKGLLPFLAAAGVIVHIQFFNDRRLRGGVLLPAGAVTTYDFSVKKDLRNPEEIAQGDGASLSAELNRASRWLKDEIFSQGPNGGTNISAVLRVALEHRCPVLVCTDGKPEGQDRPEDVTKLIGSRDNKEQTPILFIAATDQPNDVAWLRGLQEQGARDQKLFISVLMDYATEAARLSAHGDAIPFEFSTYMAMHVVFPVRAREAKGFYVYLKALADPVTPLTTEELSEMLGYTLLPQDFAYYLERRADLLRVSAAAAAQRYAASQPGPFYRPSAVLPPSLGAPPAYAALPNYPVRAVGAAAAASSVDPGASAEPVRSENCCVM